MKRLYSFIYIERALKCNHNFFLSYGHFSNEKTSPPLLPVSPLAAPANTEVSLPLQLMKAAVPAESYTLHRDLQTLTMSTVSSHVGVALFPSF